MTAITISRDITLPIEVAQHIRNGKAPTADLQNQLATAVGYAAYVDSKPVFHSAGQLVGTGGTSLVLDSLATRPRWRFAFHTGPFAWYLFGRFEIAPQNNGTPTDPYCELRIYNTSGTQVGVASVHGGSSGGSYADVPVNMTGGVGLILDPNDLTSIADLSPDTEYTGVFWDIGYARLQSASVWEVSLNPDTENGYVAANASAGAPIYSSHRNDVAAMARLLHKRSGTPIFHWCSNVDSAAPVQGSGDNLGNAALTLGALTLSSTGGGGGVGEAALTLGAMTLASTGSTASFTVTPNSGAGTVASGRNDMAFTIHIGGAVAQTSGQFAIRIGIANTSTEFDISDVIGGVDTDASGEWTQTGAWAVSGPGNSWEAFFTAATVTAFGGQLDFTLTSGDFPYGGTLYITTNFGTVSGVSGTGWSAATAQCFAPDSTPASFTVT